jgi:uncharacterized protein YggE
MRTISGIAGGVLLGLCVAAAAAAEEHSLTVLGRAELKQKPDVAFVTVFVKADALTMTDAAKEADQKVEEVKKALKKYKEIKGIEVSDAAVGETQRQFYSADQKEEGQHPEVVRRIRITTQPAPAQVYQIIDAAISAGAVMQIPSAIRYSDDTRTMVIYAVLKTAEVETQARRAALADAKQQAESLAAMAGKKLGGVVKIAIDNFSTSKYPVRIMGRESDFPTPYFGQNSKEVLIGCSFSVTFELK